MIELMVALAVLGIAVAIAVPSYDTLITTNRMAGKINEFVASLHLARSEAIKQGQNVRVCTSLDGATCNAANDWTQGWIVRVDTSGAVLKVYPALSGGDTLVGDGNTGDAIRFDRNGFALGGFNGTTVLCDNQSDLSKARAVIVATTGRVRLAADDDDDGTVEDGSGDPVVCP